MDLKIDFDAADAFLKIARDAFLKGDKTQFIAARKLVAVALHLNDVQAPNFRIGHLK